MSNIQPKDNNFLSSISGLHEILNIVNNSSRAPHTAEISRNQPGAIMFLVDQSGSMSDHVLFNNKRISCADALAEVVNDFLHNLIVRCRKDGEVRPYFDVSILSYFDDNVECQIKNIDGNEWVSTSYLNEVATKKIIEEEQEGWEGAELVTVEKNYWLKPNADGSTPMLAALKTAYNKIHSWVDTHPNSFPPIMINITDGEATDANSNDELVDQANAIKQLATNDGNVLLLNIHLSNNGNSIVFPHDRDELPEDQAAKTLYDMSSVLPKLYYKDIARMKGDTDQMSQYVGLGINASLDDLIKIINIGTLVTNNTK